MDHFEGLGADVALTAEGVILPGEEEDDKPARTAFPVTALPMGKQIEVEILAVGR